MQIKIFILLFFICTAFASSAYADDFRDDSDVEPTTPVTRYSIKLSQTPEPEIVHQLPENIAPRTHAGVDQVVNAGALVVLDAGMSRDTDGTIVSYAWKQLSGPTVELLSSRTNHPSFFAGISAATHVFQLTVRDNGGYTAIDVVTIVVRPSVAVSPSPVIPIESLQSPTPIPTLLPSFSFSNILLITFAGILLLLVITVIKVAFSRG